MSSTTQIGQSQNNNQGENGFSSFVGSTAGITAIGILILCNCICIIVLLARGKRCTGQFKTDVKYTRTPSAVASPRLNSTQTLQMFGNRVYENVNIVQTQIKSTSGMVGDVDNIDGVFTGNDDENQSEHATMGGSGLDTNAREEAGEENKTDDDDLIIGHNEALVGPSMGNNYNDNQNTSYNHNVYGGRENDNVEWAIVDNNDILDTIKKKTKEDIIDTDHVTKDGLPAPPTNQFMDDDDMLDSIKKRTKEDGYNK